MSLPGHRLQTRCTQNTPIDPGVITKSLLAARLHWVHLLAQTSGAILQPCARAEHNPCTAEALQGRTCLLQLAAEARECKHDARQVQKRNEAEIESGTISHMPGRGENGCYEVEGRKDHSLAPLHAASARRWM